MASDVEANKRAVVTSYTLALNDKDADAASVYLHPHYKQHNPTVADGIAGWRAMVNWIKTERPTFSVEIKRVIGEADFVVLHVHMKENDRDRGRAGVEIFRLEDGKIAEHWDILQLASSRPRRGRWSLGVAPVAHCHRRPLRAD